MGMDDKFAVGEKAGILVTGATGFIGSAILEKLQASDFEIYPTDRFKSPGLPLPNYKQASILDNISLLPLFKKVDCVIHAAGLAHQFENNKDRWATLREVNVEGTVNITKVAIAAGVRHLILISSVAVYGSHSPNEVSEQMPCNPEGPYAQSKYLAEQGAIQVAGEAGMDLTILRLATVYGEGDPGNLARLMRAIDRGRFLWVGSGSNRKSLIHREDVARACIAVLRKPLKGINIFNVSAPSYTMREIVEKLAKALGRSLPKWHIPVPLALGIAEMGGKFGGEKGRLAGMYSNLKKWLADDVYDATKFERTFNYQVKVGLEEGLRREVAWYRNQKERI